jgi:hypothetical protein
VNTKSIAGAARVICEAMGRPSAVPATIAVALDAGGWLNLPETAAELERLRARVAELEAERSTLVAARDAQIIAWLGKKSREYGTSNRENRAKAEAVWRMADKLSRGAVPLPEPAPATGPGQQRLAERTFAELESTHYRRLGIAPPASTREDPHDSPLHHDYRVGHDLPEMPHA